MFYFQLPTGETGPYSIDDLKAMRSKPIGDLCWETDEDFRLLQINPEVLELMLTENNLANGQEQDFDNELVDNDRDDDYVSYGDQDRNDWDAYTDGQYGDYDGPIDPELIGL